MLGKFEQYSEKGICLRQIDDVDDIISVGQSVRFWA